MINQKLIKLFQKLRGKQTTSEKLDLHALTPKQLDDDDTGVVHLKRALYSKDELNLRNIALTGPFGSGKSSVILSVTKNLKNVLNISLANFNIDSTQNNEPLEEGLSAKGTLTGPESSRLEQKIIEQIMYHVDPLKIPGSGLKKIRVNNKFVKIITAIAFIVISTYLGYIFSPTQVFIFDDIKNYIHDSNFLLNAIRILIMFSFLHLCFKLYHYILTIKDTKLKLAQADIELNSKQETSLINKYMRHIIYFFEITHYEIVFFEDLDRYHSNSIFVKLRELNQLINNSEKINGKRTVTFVYAINDGIFKSKDRTKFFDLIIPIVPVINYNNSKEKIKEISRSYELAIDDNLLEESSLYINDYRLILNIFNELRIYSDYLNKETKVGVTLNKLYPLIVLKNLFPNDFLSLTFNTGEVYNLLTGRKIFEELLLSKLKSDYHEAVKLKDKLEKLQPENLNSLRKKYVNAYTDKIDNFLYFTYRNNPLTIDKLINNDELFKQFKNDEIQQHYIMSPNSHGPSNGRQNIKFAQIENEIDPNNTYDWYEENLYEESLIDAQDTLEQIAKAKSEISTLKLSELYRRFLNSDLSNSSTFFKDYEQNKQLFSLISTFILKGYVDENYEVHLSRLYSVSMSKSDQEFVRMVKSGLEPEKNYLIESPSEVYKSLERYDFKNIGILNYSLIEFLINEDRHEEIAIIQLALKENRVSFKSFIDDLMQKQERNILEKLILSNTTLLPDAFQHFKENDQVENLTIIFLQTLNEKNIYLADNVKVDIIPHLISQKALNEPVNPKLIKEFNLKIPDLSLITSEDLLEQYFLNKSFIPNSKNLKTLFQKKRLTDLHKLSNSESIFFYEYFDEYDKNSLIEPIENLIDLNDEKNVYELLINKKIDLDNRHDIVETIPFQLRNHEYLSNISIDLIENLLIENKILFNKYSINYIISLKNTNEEFHENIDSWIDQNYKTKTNQFDVNEHVILLKYLLDNFEEYGNKTLSGYLSIFNDERLIDLPLFDYSDSELRKTLIKHSLLSVNPYYLGIICTDNPELLPLLIKSDFDSAISYLEEYKEDVNFLQPILESNLSEISLTNFLAFYNSAYLKGQLPTLIAQHVLKLKYPLIQDILFEILENAKVTFEDVKNILDYNGHLVFDAKKLHKLISNFSDILKLGSAPKLEQKDVNLNLAIILDHNRVISSYDQKNNKIIINNFRK